MPPADADLRSLRLSWAPSGYFALPCKLSTSVLQSFPTSILARRDTQWDSSARASRLHCFPLCTEGKQWHVKVEDFAAVIPARVLERVLKGDSGP